MAVVDPGPSDPSHLRELVEALASSESVQIVVTHGHGDHAEAAGELARLLGERYTTRVPETDTPADTAPRPGTVWDTDAGRLVAVSTPGHTRDHVVFHWPERHAVFAGDVLLGEGDTTWLGEYPGCVADYLSSLDVIESLDPAVVYPGHGPPVTDPLDAVARFRRHRHERIAQVAAAIAALGDVPAEQLVETVYGRALPPRLTAAAARSVEVMAHHVRTSGGLPTGAGGDA